MKKTNDKVIPHVNIGTMGHVAHGKTLLTALITETLMINKDGYHSSIEDGPLKDELESGITINPRVLKKDKPSQLPKK